MFYVQNRFCVRRRPNLRARHSSKHVCNTNEILMILRFAGSGAFTAKSKLLKIDLSRIGNLSVVCQIISYGSAIGILIMWYGISSFVGPLLVASSIVAFLTVRFVLYSSATNPDNESGLNNSISNNERAQNDRHYSDSNHRPW